MADKPNALTTEQLLIELGRVVMGLGTKIDSLGEKLDAIHEVLSREPVTEGSEAFQPFSIDPLLEKLDSIHQALSAPQLQSSGEAASVQQLDIQPLLNKLDELREDMKSTQKAEDEEGNAPAQLDMTPLLEKFDEIKAIVEKMESADEVKTLVQNLALSMEKMPSTFIEGMEKPLETVSGKLAEIHEAASDRAFVETITDSVNKVGESVKVSGSDVVKAVGEIPGKLDTIGSDISKSMENLEKKTGEILERAEESLEKTDKSLENVREELQKGLKLNTDMTGQMVEITSKFADGVEDNRISDLNSRAVQHFSNGEYKEADQLFKEALSLKPGNPELLCNSANVLAAMDDMKGAEAQFRKALEEAPDLEPALSGLGLIMVKTDRAEETIEFLKSTIRSGEPSIRTTVAYSRALAALDRHDEAVELLETALRGAPDNPEIKEELAGYGFEEKS